MERRFWITIGPNVITKVLTKKKRSEQHQSQRRYKTKAEKLSEAA